MTQPSSRYTAVAIALHWAIAIAILFMIWLGWNMHENEARYQLHKSIGIVILLLSVSRLIWRWLNPPPPLPDDLPAHERLASHAVHIGFYVVMIGLPLTGWLFVSTAYAFDVPTVLFGVISWPDIPGLGFLSNEAGHSAIGSLHGLLAWGTLLLLGLHIAGAVKHELSADEGVLKRMAPGLFGKTEAPSAPPTGFVAAFGAAFALFVVVAAAPLLSSNGSSAQAIAPVSNEDSDWVINYDASSIAFSGMHDGNPYSGDFANWSANIVFEPDQLDRARADISVQTGSASANKKLYTDSLEADEWLASSAFPTATVVVSDFEATEAGYTATAALTLKGITVETDLDFTLDITGDEAVMEGVALFERTPLDLGQASDPGADWVDEVVTVNVSVEASRK